MQRMYFINFIYESGKQLLLTDRQSLALQSLAQADAYAAKRMERFNGEFVSSITGKIAGYEILEAKPLTVRAAGEAQKGKCRQQEAPNRAANLKRTAAGHST